ncbi:Calcium/calmodulin-dependent protein kinase I, partial [Tetrabaena socialis]
SPLEPGAVLGGGKYTVVEVLGAGSNAVAYRARRADGSEVALKALSLRSLRDWKQLTLFEREASTLAGLTHPGIPRYVDYFEEDDARGDRAFVLVQEVVRGRSLAEMVAGGQRATEQEVIGIAGELLSVLEYLSSLRPPVIHRVGAGACWGPGEGG